MSTPQFSHHAPAQSVPQINTWIWLALLAAVVALLGGSSRFDAVQAAALRPLAALFLIPGLYWISRDAIGTARAPLAMLGLLALWTALQLVPLPPGLWQALPGRETVAELDALNGLEGTWRPISYVPIRGWNALFGLIIPVAGVVLALALRANLRLLLAIIVAIGIADAALGLLQVLGDRDGPLYFYTHTNLGSPVGIFANENHSGVYSVITLLAIARLGLNPGVMRRKTGIAIGLSAAFVLVTLAVMVSGSRAALGLAVASLFACALMAWLLLGRPQLEGGKAARLAIVAQYPRTLLLVCLALVGLLLYALMQFDRTPGVINAFDQNAFEDLRWKLTPVLHDMIGTYWLVGSGFGSFDAVYQIYEPTSFMTPAYLNQAHNDWAQLIIEGGLPTVLITLALLRWIAFSIPGLFARNAEALARCVFWIAIIGVLAIASLFDYPLRTPIFQLVGVWLVLGLAVDLRGERKDG